jgi:hypothetical protein
VFPHKGKLARFLNPSVSESCLILRAACREFPHHRALLAYREFGPGFPGIHLNPITGDIGPLQLHRKQTLIALAFSLVALPLWAAHVDSTDWNPTQSMTIGTKQLQPGRYQLRAEEGKSELEVVQKGKVLATIPCQWVELPAKASNSQVLTDADKVAQVQFGGRTAAIQFNQ